MPTRSRASLDSPLFQMHHTLRVRTNKRRKGAKLAQSYFFTGCRVNYFDKAKAKASVFFKIPENKHSKRFLP